MKHIKLALLILALSTLVFSSCKKSNNTPQPLAQSISLKFNGTAYSSSAPIASYSKSLNAIQIIGKFGTTAITYLAIPLNFKVGTFDIAGGGAATTFSNGANLDNTYIGTSGSVVITSFTSTAVAGTFQFTGLTTLNVSGAITEGKFQINYTNQ